MADAQKNQKDRLTIDHFDLFPRWIIITPKCPLHKVIAAKKIISRGQSFTLIGRRNKVRLDVSDL